MSIQIRTLKLIQMNEIRRQKELHIVRDELSQLGLVSFPSESTDDEDVPVPPSPPAPRDAADVSSQLARVHREQNRRDFRRDRADLRQVMRAALQANSDVEMIEILQIKRDEMPEAIKTLQRALEEMELKAMADEDSASGSSADAPFRTRGKMRATTINGSALGLEQQRFVATPSEEADMRLGGGATSSGGVDTLDREFLEGGIEALRRLSTGTDIALPSWTITRYEVDLEEKIGIGFFSDVYRARWRDHVVAVKVLAETTPKAMFVREMGIWKKLEHPNVLELLGASSATSAPPWFCAWHPESPFTLRANWSTG